MLAPSCCVQSEGHSCDLILVWGESLRALLSSPLVDGAVWKHVDGPTDGDMPTMFFCRDDLLIHLGHVTIKDYLDDYLAMILDLSKGMVDRDLDKEVREDLASRRPVETDIVSLNGMRYLPPVAVEYGTEGNQFVDSAQTDSLLFNGCYDSLPPQSKPRLGKRKSIQSFVTIVREKMGARLRHNYHRTPSKIPVCPPESGCSTCKQCEEAVELEW